MVSSLARSGALRIAFLVALVGAVAGSPAPARSQTTPDGLPPTTESATITGAAAGGFSPLRMGPGWPRVVREDVVAAAGGRAARRSSLTYFAALDELHYVDEESPARVEFFDLDNSPFTSAWFPFEAFRAFSIDQTIRSVNAFVPASPHRQRGGRRARMALALTTGDSADNQQVNEVSGYVRLLEGGRLDPNSGVTPTSPCPAGPIPAGEAERYTGVQDFDDYAETQSFYDPDQPAGRYADWPRYPGLLDRAQQPFDAAGLAVPSYVAPGNHDRLQQGNQWVNASFERVATGCVKPFAPPAGGLLTPEALLSSPTQVGAVPPDPGRASVDQRGFKALHRTGRQPDAHGFGYVDPAEERASNGAAGYFAWSPQPGVRFVSINTVSDGGVTGVSDRGNIDDPQFRWLGRVLDAARERRELVILFAHHPIGSLTSTVPDETAPPCSTGATRDENAGCDQDPRASTPIHTGAEVRDLLLARPNVIALVAGHTTELNITPFKRPDGTGGFWQIESGSVSDWPAQARLLEVMDNADGTLSIFGTLVNQAGAIDIPPTGTPAAPFSPETLASIARTIAYNDPQGGTVESEGQPEDRNVELLLPNPVRNGDGAGRAGGARQCRPGPGFRSVAVRPRGRALRIAFSRRTRAAATVDIFRVTRGRRVVEPDRVRVFRGRRQGFTWSGRGARRDGLYFVRFRIRTTSGRTDTRRIVVARRGGRFRVRPPFYRRRSCGLLTGFKLESPAFGGRRNRPLRVAFRLSRRAQVTLRVYRGRRTVRVLRAGSRAGRRTHRLRIAPAGLRRGDHRFTLSVRAAGRRARATLAARRL